MKTPTTLLTLLLTLTLAACTPTTNQAPATAEATTTPSTLSFYPLDTGLQWDYHRSGETLTNAPITTRATGPTTHNDQTMLRLTTSGRGIQTTRYYTKTNGLHLHREDRPGTTITYNPPIQVMPPSNQLQLGATWHGTTTSHITFTDTRNNINETVQFTYTYRVIDHRDINTPAGTFKAFVITRTAITPDNPTGLTQEIWYVPHVGEIRTPEGLILTRRNVR